MPQSPRIEDAVKLVFFNYSNQKVERDRQRQRQRDRENIFFLPNTYIMQLFLKE
jgi:hypothetical protein